jgi:hypothetical protein
VLRGTGILNNELYLGRLVWNRLTYVKDPSTGRRRSRRNAEAQIVSLGDPELRIVSDELWEAVKARQSGIRESEGVIRPQDALLGETPGQAPFDWSGLLRILRQPPCIDRPELPGLLGRSRARYLLQSV